MPIFGINVSSLDGEIDHGALGRAGVRFALVRASSGVRADQRFAENSEGFSERGIFTAPFHELRLNADDPAAVSAVKQAGVFARALCKTTEFSGVLTKIDKSVGETRMKRVLSVFCRQVLREVGGEVFVGICGGREVGIDASNFVERCFDRDFEKINLPRLWFWDADQYDYKCSAREAEKNCVLRQINDHGAIEGCKGVYGQNFAYGRLNELIFAAKCREPTDMISEFLCYLRKIEGSDKLIEKLTERICKGGLRLSKCAGASMSFEKRLTLIRWQCGLSDEEMRTMLRFRRVDELAAVICREILR